MNKRLPSLITMVIAVSFTSFFCTPANAKLIPLTGGGNFSITAKKQDVTIAGKTVHAMIYEDDNAPLNVATYPNGIPVLVMRLTVGDTVTCKLTNLLPDGEVPEGASIHWHGIELDNDSDGTAVTQDSVKNGQTYTYHFKVSRPGLFWFHSHMVPGDTLFAGIYGVIIVQTQCEKDMVSANKLPQDSGGYDNTNSSNTYTLALSDIEWDTRANIIVSMVTNVDMSVTTNFAPNPNFGRVGRVSDGQFKTINEWIHDCAPGQGNCTEGSSPGSTVLVNGYNPDTTRGPLTFEVKAGQMIRLRLLDEALTRSFYLKLDPTNSQKLVRIGGQGGLLDKARVEGGSGLTGAGGTGWDSFYDNGAIVLSSGVRADVVTTIPANATVGTTNTLWGIKPAAGSPWPLTRNAVPNQYPIAYFKIVAGVPNNPPAITDGTPILARGPCPAVEKLTGPTNSFLDPFPCQGTGGPNSSTIRLTRDGTTPSIDNVNIRLANPLDGNLGNGSWLTIPSLPTTRYARVGDMLQLSVRNETGGAVGGGSTTLAHPYHLHGFSLQPIAIRDNATGNTLYKFDYNEFLDTIDIYAGQTLVFNVRLDDRGKICDQAAGPVLRPCSATATGGAVGRWLYHCHIAAHGVLGMIGEIVVLDNAQQTKWLQRPDLTPSGVDVLATASLGSKTVADDFLCTSNGYITGVHVWGSWLGDNVDPNTTFELKFWTDVPAAGGKPSRPGWQIWRGLFPPGSYTNSLESFVFPNESFYDPSQSNVIGFDTQVFRYDFPIPQCLQFFDSTNTSIRGFYQRSGTIYWLSATAYTTGGLFGWKTCIPGDRFNDDASWSPTLIGPHWSDLHYPPGHSYYPQSMDMAFALDNAVTVAAPTNSTPSAVVSVPMLSVSTSDGTLNISWDGAGILQYADEATGPWNDMDGVTSPYVAPTDSPRRFFRVRLP